ncbi:Lrp/AsnC family transcriptional regulator [Streptomyces hoynatensis]|uniref:AsnC family transcriptional regulator n=1 Tax=Streptomyces hoynatensis TaxID=1141874 RepID=A0A3A9Z549_9ACTN|nr:AsnC family transcriptional regulator [Streptomyces hoynatensis]RKN42984.1 AsnC family transcriptional regulator [Streptomyces hoynatensis]
MLFDMIDRQLIHALQLDGRAPFSRIAQALGVSDQTVARRYARLRSADAVRVVGLTSAVALGQVMSAVRLRCVPSAAEDLGMALARRDDTMWVCLLSGGTEITLSVKAKPGATLLSRLPRAKGVVQVTAQTALHLFFGEALSQVNKSGVLTPGQIAMLRPPPVTGRPLADMTEQDRLLVAALKDDGRAPVADLAAVTGWSPTTVRRRIAELRADGTLYFDVDYDWAIYGLGARVAMWLSVPPSRLAETGEALAGHPEVGYCVATTGPTNLMASVICRDIESLYTYLTTRVAALPAVERMETAPVARVLKGAALRGLRPQPAVSR